MGTSGWLVLFFNMFKDIFKLIKLQGIEIKPSTF